VYLVAVKYAKDPLEYFTDRLVEALEENANESLNRLILAHSEVGGLMNNM
jgi:hypothetical protein